MELISIKEACKLTSLSRTTLWTRIKNDEFPKPIAIGGVRKAFIKSEFEAWIDARIAERDEVAA